jgi:predicted amino acid racemase
MYESYPILEIALEKITHNTKKLVSLCKRHEIAVAGVTKVFCGNPQITKAMVDGGVELLADSRIENLKRLTHFNLPKLLLRLPMLSRAREVVEFANISLNSEVDTIRALSDAAISHGTVHKIILMVDLGDLREGIISEAELFDTVSASLALEGIALYGIGTNLSCYGGVIPTKKNLASLVRQKMVIENRFNIPIEVLSGGNSSTLYLIEEGKIPEPINQIRLGESIVLGRETAFGRRLKGTYNDCFNLIAEIIEIKEKPSIPIGVLGLDAFGNKPAFVDKGIMKRALCAIGTQDVDIEDLIPIDQDITIVGMSSDHLILDITQCNHVYEVGELIKFNLTYGGILRSMTSEYVAKKYKKKVNQLSTISPS